MTILQELIKVNEQLTGGRRKKSLREELREGIDAGLASGVRREYWLEQQRKFEGGE